MALHEPIFKDRSEAGLALGQRLKDRTLYSPIVLGIPRGGVVVAAELAKALKADLDVVLSMKIRAPYHPEFAVGAISESGETFLTAQGQDLYGMTDAYLDAEKARILEEMTRRRKIFRKILPQASLKGRSVIIVDDGVATGSTLLAAIRTTRAQQPREIIVAVPVGSNDRLDELAKHCDELIVLHRPETFWAVGEFYQEFFSVDEDEVCRLLNDSLDK